MSTISNLSSLAASAAARLTGAFAWAPRAWEAREARLQLGSLDERERQDIGWTARDEATMFPVETFAYEQAKRVALKAWYGDYRRAA